MRDRIVPKSPAFADVRRGTRPATWGTTQHCCDSHKTASFESQSYLGDSAWQTRLANNWDHTVPRGEKIQHGEHGLSQAIADSFPEPRDWLPDRPRRLFLCPMWAQVLRHRRPYSA